MRQEKQDKLAYEAPKVEVVEFVTEDTIATSLDFGPSTLCGEEMW